MHKSQNENHGLFGITLTIQTRAIDIVILNKNIPKNQRIGKLSQNSKSGKDNKSDQTQIFSRHHLSAIIQPKAFPKANTQVNHKTIGIQTFRE